VAQDQRGLLDELDDASHRHRLPASGHAEERLRPVAAGDARGKGLRRGGLVARQRERSDEFELSGHGGLFDSRGRNSVAPRRATKEWKASLSPPAALRRSTVEPESPDFPRNSNPALAEEIAKRLKLHVGKALVDQFRNEETRIEIGENVRGSEAFVVQSICKAPNGNGVNDALMELILMIDALRRASAGRITAVVPYYGYAKQDKKSKGREPISAKVVANLLQVAAPNAS